MWFVRVRVRVYVFCVITGTEEGRAPSRRTSLASNLQPRRQAFLQALEDRVKVRNVRAPRFVLRGPLLEKRSTTN